MAGKLQGKKIAFIATDGFEQVEFTAPWDAVKKEGATVELISLKKGEIQGMNHDEKADKFKVDKIISEVKANEYDGLVLPGGVANPDALRMDANVISFIKELFSQKKPVAAICHGPWTLVEADVLKGRTVTSWPSLKTDIKNAGGNWVDEQVHVDQGLVTSRKPDDLEAFCKKAVEEFAEGVHDRKAA